MKQMIATTLTTTVAVAVLASASALAADITVEGQIKSTVPTGTPPLEVSSTTKVPNLNADTVDGFDGTDFYTRTELATPGQAQVDFANLINVPSDGVKAINQDCAVNSGCFSGDSAGFPVTITTPGSYRLTSNLDVTVSADPPNTTAIEVNASAVTIDLGGFAISGPVSCTGTPVTSCSGTGSGFGIEVTADNVTVVNGTIRRMGSSGIFAPVGSTCTIKNVSVIENGGLGIDCFSRDALVIGVRAIRNHREGISAGTIRNSVADGNGAAGFYAGGIVVGSVSVNNGESGIVCSSCIVLNSLFLNNSGYGIFFYGTDGIGAYGHNKLYGNGLSAIGSVGIQIDKNVCGSSLCP